RRRAGARGGAVSSGYHRDVAGDARNGWSEHAARSLEDAGHRWGSARLAVVEVLASQECCLTAREIVDELRGQGRPAGTASVYRALDLLHELGLVTRLDVGDGT